MRKFYEVVAKCGHVGREYYYEGRFYIMSDCASIAAQCVKKMGRVKRDHRDAILAVTEISYEQYIVGKHACASNPYFVCRNKREQNAVWELIEDNVFPETDMQIGYRQEHGLRRMDKQTKKEDKPKNKANNKGIRNPYKFAKLYPKIKFAWDYEIIGA